MSSKHPHPRVLRGGRRQRAANSWPTPLPTPPPPSLLIFCLLQYLHPLGPSLPPTPLTAVVYLCLTLALLHVIVQLTHLLSNLADLLAHFCQSGKRSRLTNAGQCAISLIKMFQDFFILFHFLLHFYHTEHYFHIVHNHVTVYNTLTVVPCLLFPDCLLSPVKEQGHVKSAMLTTRFFTTHSTKWVFWG